ncbi:MAG: DUF1573 domain-containing protein [Planctomycetota bacterium]
MKSPFAVSLFLAAAVVFVGNADAQYNRYQPQQPIYRGTAIPGQPYQRAQSYPYQPGVIVQPNNGATLIPGATVGGSTVTSASTIKPWVTTLIDKRDHDFGTVAIASKQEHIFEFENNTGADLFLTGIKASCGCTKPFILTNHVKPGEMARIKAVFDTKNFFGQRGATLTVWINRAGPQNDYRELQLSVKGNIRRDVVLSPGSIDFKSIALSEPVQVTARVMYAGRSDWAIQEVKSTNPNITAEAREIERNPSTGRTTYEMVVKVNEHQPTGPFNDTLTIVTNDARTSGMSFAVGGKIKPIVEIAPIALGVVNMGQMISKKLIVRSPKAFSIDDVITGHDKIKFEPSEGKKTLHILKYSLDTSEAELIDQSITIVTNDDQVRKTKVPFSVQVVESTNTSTTGQ